MQQKKVEQSLSTDAESPGQSAIRTTNNPQLEAEIAAAIEPWLAHMRWRKDFAAWRKRRIWQEDYQAANVAAVRAAVGGALAASGCLTWAAAWAGWRWPWRARARS